MNLPDLIVAQKAIAQFSGWSNPAEEDGYIYFDSPLIIAGVVQEGLFLHGGCYKGQPDRHVTFELRVKLSGRKRRALDRVDWRSNQGGHTNQDRRGSPWSGIRVDETHHHTFDLNWVQSENRLRRGNLPQAMNINQELQSFESVRDYAGKSFRINNIGLVQAPPWEYSLFRHG